MIEAVLFDWGGTLDDGAWSDELALRANGAALAEIGREDVGPEDVNRWFEINESVFRLESTDEVNLAEISRACLGALGCRVSDDELERYIQAWQEVVSAEATLHPDALRVLDELRARGLRIGLISNAFTPGRFLVPGLERSGLAARIDAVVISADHGKRKPEPSIFQAALAELGVSPGGAIFVGDRPETDLAGAAAVGMTTIQATWFAEHELPEGVGPDHVAREPLEVLDIVDRCLSATPS